MWQCGTPDLEREKEPKKRKNGRREDGRLSDRGFVSCYSWSDISLTLTRLVCDYLWQMSSVLSSRALLFCLCGHNSSTPHYNHWSFERKTLLDDKAKAQKVDFSEMLTFHSEIHKTTDFHSNLLVSWELVTEGYQGR